jgi:pimeloyl-ACP methyl ester carboxylesterase
MRYVYCHPLFDERKCSHRFSFQLSETFKQRGLILERFDYQGTGEAEGIFADVTVETLKKDLHKQVGDQEVSLIGLRFGATLAFDYLFSNPGNVKNLILIEPVIEGFDYIEYLFQKQRVKDLMTGIHQKASTENGFYNIEGYKTSFVLIEQLRKFSLVKLAEEFVGKKDFLFVQVTSFSGINTKYNFLKNLLKKNGNSVTILLSKLPPFWERLPLTDYSELTNRLSEYCSGRKRIF